MLEQDGSVADRIKKGSRIQTELGNKASSGALQFMLWLQAAMSLWLPVLFWSRSLMPSVVVQFLDLICGCSIESRPSILA
jgi:hypothetical protein